MGSVKKIAAFALVLIAVSFYAAALAAGAANVAGMSVAFTIIGHLFILGAFRVQLD
jgi:hypothetical protein